MTDEYTEIVQSCSLSFDEAVELASEIVEGLSENRSPTRGPRRELSEDEGFALFESLRSQIESGNNRHNPIPEPVARAFEEYDTSASLSASGGYTTGYFYEVSDEVHLYVYANTGYNGEIRMNEFYVVRNEQNKEKSEEWSDE